VVELQRASHDYGHVPSSESCKVMYSSPDYKRTYGVMYLPVTSFCGSSKFTQGPVSLLKLHDRHKRKQPVCVFSHNSPHEKVVFPFHQRLLASPPVISKAILTAMADWHKQTSNRFLSTHFVCANRIEYPNQDLMLLLASQSNCWDNIGGYYLKRQFD
jgi:hypothetical protein